MNKTTMNNGFRKIELEKGYRKIELEKSLPRAITRIQPKARVRDQAENDLNLLFLGSVLFAIFTYVHRYFPG